MCRHSSRLDGGLLVKWLERIESGNDAADQFSLLGRIFAVVGSFAPLDEKKKKKKKPPLSTHFFFFFITERTSDATL